MRRLLTLTAISLGALLAVPLASASANTADRIFSDCNHSPTGYLQGTYKKSDLVYALHHMPTDIAEYSGCHDAISKAIIDGNNQHRNGGATNGNGSSNGAGGTGGGGTGGGSIGGGTSGSGGTGGSGGSGATGSGSAGDGSTGSGSIGGGSGGAGGTSAATPPHQGTGDAVKFANASVTPGALPSVSRDGHTLPIALVVFLVLLGAGALTVAGTTFGRRVLAHRRA